MTITKSQTDAAEALSLVGRIDTVTSPKLQEELLEVIASAEKVELDFSKVDYVSSAGLRVLLMGQKRAQASGKTMTLKNVPREVMEVFEITGFSDILNFA
jgi:anti-sigma B factor antagonist